MLRRFGPAALGRSAGSGTPRSFNRGPPELVTVTTIATIQSTTPGRPREPAGGGLCSMKVKDPPIFKATPVTHDLYRGDNTADEPHPATIA
jgi:hypothetical protein